MTTNMRSGRSTLLFAALLAFATLIPLPHGAADAASPADRALIAYTANGGVFLMRGDGSDRRPIGMADNYAWSRDGRYLLLVRDGSLLVLDPASGATRTLATGISEDDFPPAWAIDGDTILYERSGGAAPTTHTVSMVDLSGRSTLLWRFAGREGCGGGAPFAPEYLQWREVGLNGVAGGMQWSMARHLAVYSASCSGGLNVTDTRTGRTQPLNPPGTTWFEPALSPQGGLAVMAARDLGSARSIVLTSPVPRARAITVAPGELPRWSVDGQTLYFEQITAAKPVPYVGAAGTQNAAPAHVSSIWRVGANGAGPSRIYAQNAYALGPLSLLAGSAGLVFSSVDNVTAAAKQYLTTGADSAAVASHVRIMRLDLATGRAGTLLISAGRPQGQP